MKLEVVPYDSKSEESALCLLRRSSVLVDLPPIYGRCMPRRWVGDGSELEVSSNMLGWI